MTIKHILALLVAASTSWGVGAQEPTLPTESVQIPTPVAEVVEVLAEPSQMAEVAEEVVEIRYPMVEFQERLAQPDTLGGARAEVRIHRSAAEAIEKYNAQTTPKEFYQGYRIRIFSSHNQSARTDAEAAVELFREHYNVPVYLAYENPYFLVTCGNCLTHEEAIMLLAKVRIHFPKAFVVTCEIPAEALTTPPAPPVVVAAEGGDVATTEPIATEVLTDEQLDAMEEGELVPANSIE